MSDAMSERDYALALANSVLDLHYEDPDSHRSVLARQLIRSREREDRYRAALEKIATVTAMRSTAGSRRCSVIAQAALDGKEAPK